MKSALYKQRKINWFAVFVPELLISLAGLTFEARVLAALLVLLWLWYCAIHSLSNFSSLKKIDRDNYGTGPRRRKDAEVVDDDDKDNDGWFW